MEAIAAIRESLRSARLALQQDYAARPHPARLLRNHSKIVDAHLQDLWAQMQFPPKFALVAVGGYGRAELYPRSDVDLLILLPDDTEAGTHPSLSLFIQHLWDMGLEIGHSVRTVPQCLEESRDITVQTNLLESRHICGGAQLPLELHRLLLQHLDPQAFFLAKLNEQEIRNRRYQDTDFNLEPNLKESPGGLRTIQTLFWISRACQFGHRWSDLVSAGFITPVEARQFAAHERRLQDLRIRLHFLSGRHDDRILFEYQTELASQLGIKASAQRRPSEHLMQHYYRTKKAVILLADLLLQNMRARLFQSGDTYPLNARFIARNDKLEARDDELFETQPSAILESFLLLAQHPRLNGYSASTLRALWRARPHIDAEFRRAPENRRCFMEILRQPQGQTHVLRHMNQLDILGRYLPPFGRIVGQMQFDLFHVYTVDEHILMVVRNLRRFTLPEHAQENPLSHKLMRDFARPEVLYVAGLFHDIAKGRGGDHSTLGRIDAQRFCKHHQISNEDTELVIWLVEQHLSMSATAQKQDLSDQDVIAAFIAKIKNERHLAALYLLTVADIRGTSPKVWNAWKAKLLEDLYHAAFRYMRSGKPTDLLGEIRQHSMENLSLEAIAPESYEMLWAQLDSDYFLQHDPSEIAWHTRLLAQQVNADSPIVRARLSRVASGIQVMVYAKDKPFLFSCICNFFSQMSYSIMEAKVHTTQHGYALDSFLVMDVNNESANYRDLMNYIEYELAHKLGRDATPQSPHTGRVSRQLKHFPIVPEINLTQDEKGQYILSITAGDRPGLLARIAYLLAKHHIELLSAKINTLGGRAEDTFWVSGKNLPHGNSKLFDELHQQLS